MEKQKTILKEVRISGVGLHTGNKANVVLKPAAADSGIHFIRTDSPERLRVPATVDSLFSLSRSPRRTSIGKEPFEVQTVEHLLSALSGLGIDNLDIEIDNNELPGMDGSALAFLELVKTAGIQELDRERKVFALKEPIFVSEGSSSIAAFPAQEFRISYTLDYSHPFIKTSLFECVLDKDTYEAQIAGARTFCLEEEAQALQDQGLGKGANYDNTLVVGKNGVIKNDLRFSDEFVRHKVSDLIGDLSMLGFPLKAHIIAIKSGHSLNLKLAKKILEQKGQGSSAHLPMVLPGTQLYIEDIMKILPHREPFLFVDRIIQMEVGKKATGIKNVTINDYFFKGHFPGRPVMPGVLIVEAMAQVGGVMMLASEENRGKLAFFMAADKIKFRKTVVPGDQLVFEVEAGRIKARTGQVFARALVDGKVVCEGELMFALADR